MKLLLFSILLLFSLKLSAQKSKPDTIIKRDTINLRGYVYDQTGKPVRHIRLLSTQRSMDAPSWHIGAVTDTAGYFQIEGSKFNDTLTFEANVLYRLVPIYNKGSRYMVIYLASAIPVDITADNPIMVSALRKHKKATPSFNVTYSQANIDNFEIHMIPRFKEGNKHFVEQIKQQLQYPQKAVDKNIEGTVTIGFQIERDGTPINFKVLQGIGYGCEEELINAIKRLGGWIPGIDNGRPILMEQTVSVEFKLTDK
jgi:TonB family protein